MANVFVGQAAVLNAAFASGGVPPGTFAPRTKQGNVQPQTVEQINRQRSGQPGTFPQPRQPIPLPESMGGPSMPYQQLPDPRINGLTPNQRSELLRRIAEDIRTGKHPAPWEKNPLAPFMHSDTAANLALEKQQKAWERSITSATPRQPGGPLPIQPPPSIPGTETGLLRSILQAIERGKVSPLAAILIGKALADFVSDRINDAYPTYTARTLTPQEQAARKLARDLQRLQEINVLAWTDP